MSEARVRIDVWLWRARLVKTRAAASRLLSEGGVRVVHRDGASRALNKPSAEIAPGDTLLIPAGGVIRSVTVRAIGVRRGPSAEARTLYGDV